MTQDTVSFMQLLSYLNVGSVYLIFIVLSAAEVVLFIVFAAPFHGLVYDIAINVKTSALENKSEDNCQLGPEFY